MPGTGGGKGVRIFFSNLPDKTNWRSLRDHCKSQEVEVWHVNLIGDRKTGKPTGQAQATLSDHTGVETSIGKLNNSVFDGREILVWEDPGDRPLGGKDGGKGGRDKGAGKGGEWWSSNDADYSRRNEGGGGVWRALDTDWKDRDWEQGNNSWGGKLPKVLDEEGSGR